MPEEEKTQIVDTIVSEGQQVAPPPASEESASDSLTSGGGSRGLLGNQENSLDSNPDHDDSLSEELSRQGVERVSCDVPACQWFRPITSSISYAQALETYGLHLLARHGISKTGTPASSMDTLGLMSDTLAQLVAQGASPRLQSAKLESAPRPTCQEGMSLTEWRVFQHNWDLYKQSTRMAPDQESVQLWATLSPGVSKSLISSQLKWCLLHGPRVKGGRH